LCRRRRNGSAQNSRSPRFLDWSGPCRACLGRLERRSALGGGRSGTDCPMAGRGLASSRWRPVVHLAWPGSGCRVCCCPPPPPAAGQGRATLRQAARAAAGRACTSCRLLHASRGVRRPGMSATARRRSSGGSGGGLYAPPGNAPGSAAACNVILTDPGPLDPPAAPSTLAPMRAPQSMSGARYPATSRSTCPMRLPSA